MMEEQYIKMLRAKGAEWIQEGYKWKDGDWYLADYTDTGWINGIERRLFSVHNFGDETLKELRNTEPRDGKTGKVKIFYLPSIEDLLGMMRKEDSYLDDYELVGDFYEFLVKILAYNFESMTELWFAFIQHELKGLKWDGEEWV